MKTKYKAIFLVLLIVGFITLLSLLVKGHTVAILMPQGTIATQERSLIITATLLMLVIIIPVFVLAILIAWRYRATNTKAIYTPNWEHNRVEEFIWWAVPCMIIIGLAVITWRTSHTLDPFKPLESNVPPLTIQVIALNWKWLFIYPAQGIATVNFVEFPTDTPINFQITADAPMNSFWIPQLGGQIYAMAGMTTQLHLMADEVGDYAGSSANFSGAGFSGMRFIARAASTTEDFDAWIRSAKQSTSTLSEDTYNDLVQPSENNPVTYYGSVDTALFHDILAKFMSPDSPIGSMGDMSM